MARINIEEHFWFEINRVSARMGSEDLAVGQAVRLFRVAQQRALQNKFLNKEDWERNGFSEALIPTFVEKVGEEYVVKGADKHFGWLKKQAIYGKRGGLKSRAHNKIQEGSQEPTATERFNERFRKEIPEFKKIIESLKIPSPSLKRIVPDVARAFNYQTKDFESWIEGITGSPGFQKISDSQGRSRYFVNSLKREINYIKELK